MTLMSPSEPAACPCRGATVEAVHHVGRGHATHLDARAVLLGVLEHTFAVPLGNEVERVRVGALDACALQYGSKYATSTNLVPRL